MARQRDRAAARAARQQQQADARAANGLPPIPIGGRLIDPKPTLKQFAKSVDELELFGDLVMIREIKDEMTAGGIALPDGSSTEGPRKGEVVAVGPGSMKEDASYMPMNVEVGDMVYLAGILGRPLTMNIGGADHLLIPDSQIAMKVRKTAAESPIVTD
jgi:chaperonin GroES